MSRHLSLVVSPEQPPAETHIADVDDDSKRALCGRVGLPIVKHAATCPDCHDEMLAKAAIALGVRNLSAYRIATGGARKRMYQFAPPAILERFGFAMDMPPRVGEGAALQDVLMAIRDGINRLLGEVQT